MVDINTFKSNEERKQEYYPFDEYCFEIYTLNHLCLYIHEVMAKIGFVCIRSGIDENNNNKIYYEGFDNDGNKMRITFIKNNKE